METMPTFVPLSEHTQAWDEGIKRTPNVDTEVAERFQSVGAEAIDGYLGPIGNYAGIGLIAGPDRETGETIQLVFEREDTHHSENYEVFEAA